jgi:hypothetical protein
LKLKCGPSQEDKKFEPCGEAPQCVNLGNKKVFLILKVDEDWNVGKDEEFLKRINVIRLRPS